MNMVSEIVVETSKYNTLFRLTNLYGMETLNEKKKEFNPGMFRT